MASSATAPARRATRTGRGLAGLTLAGATAAISVGLATPALAAPTTGTPAVRSVCSAPVRPGFAACDAVVVASPRAGAATYAAMPAGYGPADLSSAYRLPAGPAGSGRTVPIVDAYNDPNAESDLAVYRSTYGLPACTTANGCFRKVDQNRGTRFPAADPGW